MAATIDRRQNGLFVQQRVGRDGELFQVIKNRTMRNNPTIRTTVIQASDPRITKLGRLLRCTKTYELPQLFNVVLGEMRFVGPRPDVSGFADHLSDVDSRN